MSGMRLQPHFEFEPEKGRTYVLAPNHSSYLDIPAVTVMLPLYFNFMAKDELRRLPLFGIFFSRLDIAVERQSIMASHRSFVEAAKRIQQGTNICVFPEGTINTDAPKLGRFKDGAFRLAIENQVDIVPITFPDNHKRLKDGVFTCTPGKLRMFVHRPVSTAHLKPEDADLLKKQVFAIIEEKLKEYESNG
jgi:1-acyl-sn-glycerol-3-phosphate acyltransferase